MLGACLCAATLVAAAVPQEPAQEPPPPQSGQAGQAGQPFRAGVELVSLNVTVTGAPGHFVTDLAKDELEVYEDGVKQDLTFFNNTQLPIALSFLMDTSASMEDRLETAQEAAIGFASRLRPEDLAELIDFDSRVEILQPFTSDVSALEKAIRQTRAGGSTSLHNAIYISLKELKKVTAKAPGEIRRQAIVVLSDGEDTSSLVGFDEVLDLTKRSETAIYTIGLRTRLGQQRGFKEADYVLRTLAQETGGRAYFPDKIEDLAGVYGQIAEELSSQYTLGYTSKNSRRDGQWRRIVVRTTRPNLAARTKQGYYARTQP